MELGFFGKLRIFKWGAGGFFIMVEAILGWLKLLREVMFFRFLVDCGRGGKADIFREA